MVDRYPGKRSEYGGGDGLIQRLPDTSTVPLEDLADGAGRRAQLLRMAGIADYDPARVDEVGFALGGIDATGMSFAQQQAARIDYEESERRRAERRKLNAKTNGYIDDQPQTGDAVS